MKAVKRVLDGEAKGGFQTPATIFGSGFVTTILGSVLEVMENCKEMLIVVYLAVENIHTTRA